MIEIKQVSTKKQRKQFVEFPLNLYKNNPNFVPPLYADEMAMFKKDYFYNDQAKSAFFLAYRDGKVVGRIQGILQMAANEKWGQKRVRFTRFDAIDDQEVASALFNAVEEWGKSLGMTEIVGPLGYSDLEREGLLIEGFEYLATFEEQYNYAYYQNLVESCGYEKDIDWLEHQVRRPIGKDEEIERVKKLSARMMEKYNLHFGTAKNTAEFVKKYADKIFRVWDEAYSNIYGCVPFTDRVKKQMLEQFKLVIDMRFISVILDENEQLVAFGFAFPSIAKAVQKSGGRLTIPCLIRLLKAIKNPKVLDLAIVGVVDKYRNKGVSMNLFAMILTMLEHDIDFMETNLNLENNYPILNMWKSFDTIQHKRRRCYVKKLVDETTTVIAE